MEALVRAKLPARIAAVISNEPGAAGLEFTARQGIAAEVIDHRGFASREAFDAELAGAIDRHGPDLVLLAGFLRILTPGLVRGYAGRMMNVHPSLLPAFPGLRTHRRALEEGVKVHGCSVHFVTPDLDHGPIVIQAAVPVRPGDSEERLAARVLRQEHRVYPLAARWFLEERLVIADGVVRVTGQDADQFLLSDE